MLELTPELCVTPELCAELCGSPESPATSFLY